LAKLPPPIVTAVEEEFEIYYLGNQNHPNEMEAGYICNASYFGQTWKGVTPSSILWYVGQQFGGGTFQIVRVRDGEVVSERTIYLPGPTKLDVIMHRETALNL
jgi:hypothetical protein